MYKCVICWNQWMRQMWTCVFVFVIGVSFKRWCIRSTSLCSTDIWQLCLLFFVFYRTLMWIWIHCDVVLVVRRDHPGRDVRSSLNHSNFPNLFFNFIENKIRSTKRRENKEKNRKEKNQREKMEKKVNALVMLLWISRIVIMLLEFGHEKMSWNRPKDMREKLN